MSAKLAKKLLGKGKPAAPKAIAESDQDAASSPKVHIKKAAAIKSKDIVAPPDHTKQPLDDMEPRKNRCLTEDMDDVQKYCHLNPPPPPPTQPSETEEVSPELSSEAKEFIEEYNDSDDHTTQRPPPPPSPESLLRPGAKEFINQCNNELEEQPPQPPPPLEIEGERQSPAQASRPTSPETTEETTPPAPSPEVSENASSQEPSPTVLSEGKFFSSASKNDTSSDPPPPEEAEKDDATSKTVLSEGKFFSSSSKNDTSLDPPPPEEAKKDNATSKPSSSDGCGACDCTQSPFKDGFCIDHYRLKKNPSSNHKFLNSDGQARLSNEKLCNQVNKKFQADKTYETTPEQMDDLKKRFIEMDEDGSGDIDVLELGRAMEKLGKPKNQLQLRKMIAEVDISGSGTIEYEEFVLMMIGASSSVLRLILLFEKKSQGEKQPPKGKKKPMINLFA